MAQPEGRRRRACAKPQRKTRDLISADRNVTRIYHSALKEVPALEVNKGSLQRGVQIDIVDLGDSSCAAIMQAHHITSRPCKLLDGRAQACLIRVQEKNPPISWNPVSTRPRIEPLLQKLQHVRRAVESLLLKGDTAADALWEGNVLQHSGGLAFEQHIDWQAAGLKGSAPLRRPM